MFKQKKNIWSRQDVPGHPGKVPGLDRTGPRDPEGPVVPWLKKSKIPGTWKLEKSRDNGNPNTYIPKHGTMGSYSFWKSLAIRYFHYVFDKVTKFEKIPSFIQSLLSNVKKGGGDFWGISELYYGKSWVQIKILVLKEF